MAQIEIHVEEVTMEATDPNEENLLLTFNQADAPFLSAGGDATARAFPDYGFSAISTLGGDIPLDVQVHKGRPDDPQAAKFEVPVPKSLFAVVPTDGSDIVALTTSHAIILLS